MARTWSTFNAPPQWGKITGIPSDLADGEINWNEIKNKPSTFPHDGIFSNNLEINRNLSANLFLNSIGTNLVYNTIYFSNNGIVRWALGMGNVGDNANNPMLFISSFDSQGNFIRNNLFLDMGGNIIIPSLPISSWGLPSGAMWRDNGYLRIV